MAFTDKQRLHQLLVKFGCDTLSTKEWKELRDLIEKGALDNELSALIASAWNQENMNNAWDKKDAEICWQKILAETERQLVPSGNSSTGKKSSLKISRKSFSPVYRWWMSVAAVVLIAVAGAFLYQFYFSKQNPIASSFAHNDIQPGHKTAILKLSDGNSINIDSVPPGIIGRQGDIAIIKKANGDIVYEGKTTDQLVYNEVVTLKGQELNIYLPDGTQVFLNAASSIRYPLTFAAKERLVTMTGEAYFNVKHMEKVPFRIRLQNQIIEDVGTEFNVNAYNDEPNIKTTLLKGAVKITRGNKSVSLLPDQQAITDTDKTTNISVIYPGNIDQVIAWKNGYFSFKNDSLEDVMRQIARWYDVKVDYKGEKTQELFIADVPRDVSISKFLKILELTGWVKFEIDGKTITVISNN